MNPPAAPPSYEQSEGFSNAHYTGPNPTYPNAFSENQPIPIKNTGAPYNPPLQQPAPVQSPPQRTTFLTATQYPGNSVHIVTPVTTATIATSVPLVTSGRLGPYPCTIMCRHCNEQITTVTKTEPGMVAWISSGVLILMGCIFGCCLIPFCIDACKDVYHKCPRCNAFLGKYTRLR